MNNFYVTLSVSEQVIFHVFYERKKIVKILLYTYSRLNFLKDFLMKIYKMLYFNSKILCTNNKCLIFLLFYYNVSKCVTNVFNKLIRSQRILLSKIRKQLKL